MFIFVLSLLYFCSFITLKVLFHYLLIYMISAEKSVYSQIVVPLIAMYRFSHYFQDLLLLLLFISFTMMCPGVVSLHISFGAS